MLRTAVLRKSRTAPPQSSSYGVSDSHLAMEELPHPSRNLTVSRVVIMVTVAVLVGVLTISTWYFTHSYPKTAVASLSESLRLEVLVNTSELLDEIFKMNTYGSMAISNLMEKKFFGDDFGIDCLDKVRGAMWSIFKAMPTITTLGLTALNGLTVVYVRGNNNELEGYQGTFAVYTNSTSTHPVYYKEFVSEYTGDPMRTPIVEHMEVPLHNRKWFLDALTVPMNNISWALARSMISGQAFIQCSIPVQARMSKEVAVVHSAHSAVAINDFISSLDLKGGSVFVADQQGKLLFSSDSTVCVPRNKSQCEATPVVWDSVLNEGKDFLQNEVGLQNLVNIRTHFADVTLRGKRYSVDSWPYAFHTVKLAVVVMIPRHSFWGPMDYYTRITWISLPLLSLGVVFIGCSLIYLLVEQVQAEEKLRAEIERQSEAKRRAEASRDAKTNFLSSMSHELRTPMACIIGLLDMLLSEKLSQETEGSVRQIHRCATSLVALLNSALDIAKVESGKLVLEKAEFDLEAELTALIDVFSVQCDTKDLFISLQLADDVPKNVIGDSARVMQVFTNLIGNSIKFTCKGRISVRGRLAALESGGNPGRLHRRSFSSFSLDMFNEITPSEEVLILFEVDDTGPGIDPALRERVFENFVQGDASTTRTHGGTGLGLGIVRSLVQLMGGNIRIVEKAGPGAIFQFTVCFQRSLRPERVPYPLPSSLQGAEVVLGIPDADCRGVAAHWVRVRGLVAHQFETWDQILLHMRALNGTSVDHQRRLSGVKQRFSADCVQPLACLDEGPKSPIGVTQKRSSRYEFWKSWKNIGAKALSGQERQVLIIDISLLPSIVEHAYLQEYLQQSGFLTGTPALCLDGLGLEKLDLNERQLTDIQRNLLVVWVTASNTPEPVKAALRSVRNSITVRRPLHSARLKELFRQIAREGGDTYPITETEKPTRVLSSNALAYAKQQEWDDPYGVDTGVSLAGVSKPEPKPEPLISSQLPITSTEQAAKVILAPVLSEFNLQSRDSSANIDTGSESCLTQDEPSLQIPRSTTLSSKPVNTLRRPRFQLKKKHTVRILSKPFERLEILVAEDTPLLRKLAVAMLRRLGANTHEAANGLEVINEVRDRMSTGQPPFNCILMDCQVLKKVGSDGSLSWPCEECIVTDTHTSCIDMPVMDGYEACKAVREAEHEGLQRTSIIALTANAMASDEQKCLHAGMDAFLTKPIDQEYMVQIILRTLTPEVTAKPPTPEKLNEVESGGQRDKNGFSRRPESELPII